MKKKLSIICSLLLVVLLAGILSGCGETKGQSDADGKSGENFTVGICQLVQHDALDAATQGFKDSLTAEFGDAITFEEGNASGDSATCSTIVNGFVSGEVDLIMANATPALQAAASATNEIPILGTSISSYGAALNIDNFDGVVGGNISGTTDLAPLDQQAAMFKELLPNAKTIGILYCSSEANSVYQAETVEKELKALGFNVNIFTFADSNDVALVTSTAIDEVDALYIPTDNVAASCGSTIKEIIAPAKIPVITGEESMCLNICGLATLSISYYDLGTLTGQMAAQILKGEADVSTMAVQAFPSPKKEFLPETAEKLGITMPSDYVAIEQ